MQRLLIAFALCLVPVGSWAQVAPKAGALDFTTLKRRLAVADGALGLHLRKLEESGYIRSHKRFVGRRPKTTYRLTASGRRAFAAYLKSLGELLEAVDAANRT